MLSNREEISYALKKVWENNPVDVAKFGLEWRREKFEECYGGYIVRVKSNILTGSSYELVRILSGLQEQIENECGLNVSLFLSHEQEYYDVD